MNLAQTFKADSWNLNFILERYSTPASGIISAPANEIQRKVPDKIISFQPQRQV